MEELVTGWDEVPVGEGVGQKGGWGTAGGFGHPG